MESVLLLNASYEPMGVISWRRAVSLWFSGKVEVVEEYDRDIRSVSIIIKAPAVVRLLRYINVRGRNVPLTRINIFARDGFSCQYCGITVKATQATLDHVLPRSRGGQTSWENMVCCCVKCNRKKGHCTPKEASMPLRSTPTKPKWVPILTLKLNGRIPNVWQEFLSHWR